MKIIFLDIDGVFNNANDPMNAQRPFTALELSKEIDKDRVSLLNRIIEETGAKVVISSSWRMSVDLDMIIETFKLQGFKGEIIDHTPIKLSYVDRGQEINWWLEDNEVDSFAVIDDINFSGFCRYEDKLVLVSDDNGMTEEDANKVIDILGKL
jgi:hypothetical protein